MVYNEKLANKIRDQITRRKGWTEKKMFGGIAFMLNGNMCCGVISNDLMVRVGVDRNDEALGLPNSRAMDFTGKSMKGFIYVSSGGWSNEASLKKWIQMGIDYASKLPKKESSQKLD